MSAPTAGTPMEEDPRAGDPRERRRRVIATLSATWPRVGGEDAGKGVVDGEVATFLNGHGASLPYFLRDEILWVTVAASAADLHREIELLRAWVIPSYAWEDPARPFVVPGEGTGRLSEVLFEVSPAGYFRWRCSRTDYNAVGGRLSRMRQLLAHRPEHLFERVPSLLEFRQQFRIALVTGDREAAESFLHAIDLYQLDSAVNTHLMRVRVLDRFGEYAAIVTDPALDRLLELRLPEAVRTAVVRAFHAVYLAGLEADGVDAAAMAFAERVQPVIGGLLVLAVPEDGPEIARCLAYRAWTYRSREQAAALLSAADDFVSPLLRRLIADEPAGPRPSADLATEFQRAIHRGDVRAIQALAPALLAGLSSSPSVRADVVDAVRASLEVMPNPGVAAQLARADSAPHATMPQSWGELLERLRGGDFEAAERFLALDHSERPSPEKLTNQERDAAIATLEEFLTHPAFGPDAPERRYTEAALPAFVEDFVSDPQFPRPFLAPLYLHLLRLWAEHKRGSAYGPDGQLLLVLASAVLQHLTGIEQEVAQYLIDWWRARPVRAALPFLLEAVDVALELIASDGPAQQLWLDGAALAARHEEGLARTERELWRRLGRSAGFDSATVDQVLPPVVTVAGVEVAIDPIRQARLQGIAIVSLHRRAADEARALIAERSDAKVFVVDELVPGPATKSAQSADLILFVWAATKHAVFRAFDSVRDRMVYVQGSGAGSIVLALERWATRRLEAT